MAASPQALKLRGVYMGLMNRVGVTKKVKAEAKEIKSHKGVCSAISFLRAVGLPGRRTAKGAARVAWLARDRKSRKKRTK